MELTQNPSVLELVRKTAELTTPKEIVWIDGSEAQLESLRKIALETGELIKLNEEKLPGCYLNRSDVNDVARVEGRTFICSRTREEAGPTNNWNGTGKRITIKDTRGIIDAILSGDILKAETKKIPMFDLEVPTALPGVNPAILDPRDTYANVEEWETKAKDLAGRFVKNFVKYEGNDAGKALVEAGPKL